MISCESNGRDKVHERVNAPEVFPCPSTLSAGGVITRIEQSRKFSHMGSCAGPSFSFGDLSVIGSQSRNARFCSFGAGRQGKKCSHSGRSGGGDGKGSGGCFVSCFNHPTWTASGAAMMVAS